TQEHPPFPGVPERGRVGADRVYKVTGELPRIRKRTCFVEPYGARLQSLRHHQVFTSPFEDVRIRQLKPLLQHHALVRPVESIRACRKSNDALLATQNLKEHIPGAIRPDHERIGYAIGGNILDISGAENGIGDAGGGSKPERRIAGVDAGGPHLLRLAGGLNANTTAAPGSEIRNRMAGRCEPAATSHRQPHRRFHSRAQPLAFPSWKRYNTNCKDWVFPMGWKPPDGSNENPRRCN